MTAAPLPVEPADRLAYALDRGAVLSFHTQPRRVRRTDAGALEMTGTLARLECLTRAPEPEPPLSRETQALLRAIEHREPIAPRARFAARQLVGEAAGTYTIRLEAAGEAACAGAAQSFPSLRARFEFGTNAEGTDAAGGVGSAAAWPGHTEAPPSLFAGAGVLGDLRGRLARLQGVFVLNGVLDPRTGFDGAIIVRLYDPDSAISTEREISEMRAGPWPVPSTLFTMQAGARHALEADACGLLFRAEARPARAICSTRGYRGVQCRLEAGEPIGTVGVRILLPESSVERPLATFDYHVNDSSGRPAGSLRAEIEEGVSVELAGTGARLGASWGSLTGDGIFDGVSGVLTDLSAVCAARRVLSLFQALRIDDRARYHAA